MTVTPEQLKALQPGDEVTLACGARIKVAGAVHNGKFVSVHFQGFDNDVRAYYYNLRGKYPKHNDPDADTLIDIIAIHPKPFDWKDVRPGMAFRVGSKGEPVWYAAPFFKQERTHVVVYTKLNGGTGKYPSTPGGAMKQYLTRAPELDVEWPDA